MKRKPKSADGVVLFVLVSGAIGSCVGGGVMADSGRLWTGLSIFAVGTILAIVAVVQLVGIAIMTNNIEDKGP